MKGITENQEHELCVSCGFCCDGTLFDVARFHDTDPRFPEIEKKAVVIKGESCFELPCPFHKGKCTIYDQKKLAICSSFKCILLQKAIVGEVPMEEAMNAVKEVKFLRAEIDEKYQLFTGQSPSFRKKLKFFESDSQFDGNEEWEELKLKARLLDILLSRHFKSKEQFSDYYEIEEID